MILLTSLAGGLGGASRFLVDSAVSRFNRWSIPIGTMVVNASACLFLGALAGYFLAHPGGEDALAIVGVGFLGGYSTFSTASVEGARLLLDGRVRAAIIHGGGMLLVSLAASWLGLLLGGMLP